MRPWIPFPRREYGVAIQHSSWTIGEFERVAFVLSKIVSTNPTKYLTRCIMESNMCFERLREGFWWMFVWTLWGEGGSVKCLIFLSWTCNNRALACSWRWRIRYCLLKWQHHQCMRIVGELNMLHSITHSSSHEVHLSRLASSIFLRRSRTSSRVDMTAYCKWWGRLSFGSAYSHNHNHNHKHKHKHNHKALSGHDSYLSRTNLISQEFFSSDFRILKSLI